MRAAYEPLISTLQKCIESQPDSSRSYSMLGEIYCCLNEMDLCLQIRTEGYENTGNEELNPKGYTDTEHADGVTLTYDSWGRIIEQLTPDLHDTFEYGEGKQVSRRVSGWRIEPSSPFEYQYEEYQYENGRRVSRTVDIESENGVDRTITYDYPEPGTCIEYENYGVFSFKTAITFNEYGQVIRRDVYGDDGEIVDSYNG